MQRSELDHVLRASAAIANENSFVLIGSQAVLLLLDEPPPELLRSTEIDLYLALHPEKADLIDGANRCAVHFSRYLWVSRMTYPTSNNGPSAACWKTNK